MDGHARICTCPHLRIGQGACPGLYIRESEEWGSFWPVDSMPLHSATEEKQSFQQAPTRPLGWTTKDSNTQCNLAELAQPETLGPSAEAQPISSCFQQ